MISVLYVDDEELLRDLTRTYLDSKGFPIDTAESGAEALEKLKTGTYDAVVADYEMPGMNGIALLKEVRVWYPELPFILFTGRGREEVVIEAFDCGADYYLQKGGRPAPQFAELIHKIKLAVNRRRTERDLTRKHEELAAAYEELTATEEELRRNYDDLAISRQELQESEQRFRTLVERVPLPLCFVNKDRAFTYFNERFTRIFGYTIQDIPTLAEWWVAGYPDESYREWVMETWEADVKRAAEEHIDIQSREYTVTCKDGTRRIIIISGITIEDNFLATFVDITDRKQAEEAVIRINETLLRQTKTLSILNRIIITANHAETCQQLFDEILDESLDLLDYDAGGIYLVDQSTGTAIVVCSKNLSDEFLSEIRTIPVNNPPYDSLFVRGIPIITDHYEQVAPERSQKYGFCSLVSVPLYAKDRIVGALNVVSTQRYVVSEEEKQTLISIGWELGTIIERIRTGEESNKN